MIVTKTNSDGTVVRHRLDQQTDAGDFLVLCGDLIAKNFAVVSTDGSHTVDCPGCESPARRALTAPATGRVPKHYRRAKNTHREATESLKFAHVEIVAALEWLARGGEDQFFATAMDRAMLGYRFLHDMLREYGEDRLAHAGLDVDLLPEDDDH